MASTPTTKSQVQAYKFVIRRMESALARKDAVMLHDPLGSHKRATIAGAIIACIGMIGFLVWGLFGGQGTVPKPGSVVVAKESGSVYVVTSDDKAKKRLVPMLNMASAKLLVMANGGGKGQPIETTKVKEAALSEFPRGPKTGMPNAPEFLPSADNVASPKWAICDVGEVASAMSRSRIQTSTQVHTTVVGGASAKGSELGVGQSLYVQDRSSGRRYLIYRAKLPNRPNTHVVRASVDPEEDAVMEMFGLSGATPRTISTNLLNSVPSVGGLSAPSLPSVASPEYSVDTGSYRLGDVLESSVPGESNKYYVLLPSGKQEISQGAAAVLHASRYTSRDLPNATGMLTEIDEADDTDKLSVSQFPIGVPQPVTFQESANSCLSWVSDSDGAKLTMKLNSGSPVDKAPVKLAQYDGSGPRVDFFYMPPGKAAVVRSANRVGGSEAGPIYLVSDRGVKFGIKDPATAKGLGVIHGAGDIKSAPSAVLDSLPTGAFLDPARASLVYDSIPLDEDGGVNRPQNNQQGSGAELSSSTGS